MMMQPVQVTHGINVKMDMASIMEQVVEKMCHAPAICFEIKDRGYLREGYFADVVLFDAKEKYVVGDNSNNGTVLYKCGWSPLDGYKFTGKVKQTFVNGNMIYDNGKFNERYKGERLEFERA